jgi:hypothetical protein
MENNLMIGRSLPVQTSWLSVLGAMLLLAPPIVSSFAESRVRLDADVLARSRGGDPLQVLSSSSCDALNTNFPCVNLAPGANCATCGIVNFTALTGGSNGGYFSSGQASCGANWSGTCSTTNVCVKSTPIGWCAPPPGVITQ